MAELRGSVGAIGLPAIVQLIGELHQSGRLELTKGQSRGTLGFEDGRLVSADFGEERGLSALAACTLDFDDGEFSFVAGAVIGERTMDFGPAGLQRLMVQIARRATLTEAGAQSAATLNDQTRAATVCPKLGFADDPPHHHSRPTALHRCYASPVPSVVTSQEQLELCLGGQYSTCPRFRDAAAPDRLIQRPRPPQEKPVPAPTARAAGDTVRPAAPSAIPAGDTVRTAAASKGQPPAPAVDQRVAALPARARVAAPVSGAETSSRGFGRRRLLLVGVGVAVGLVGPAVALVVVLPALGGPITPSSSRMASQVFEPLSSPTRAVATAARPTLVPTLARAVATVVHPTPVPTLAPTATAPRRALTPAAAPPPPAAAVGRSLMDARFAAGPVHDWLENPPWVGWSAGAYRLQASEPKRFVAVGVPIDQVLGDVVVSATFRKTGGPPGGGYGVIVRDQGPAPRDGSNQEANAYVLEAGDLGEFGIWRRDGDHWVDLIPWTASSSVRPGGSPNDLTVGAMGDRLTFTINGAQVATVQDDTLASGGIGVFVGGDYNQVALDRFAVHAPD